MGLDAQLIPNPQARIVELDGLRGIAVSVVLVWHYLGAIIDRTLGVWADAIAHVAVLGSTGVDLFFVLSGFLITGIVLDRKQRPSGFLGAFYIRRSLRILPPYLLLVAVFWMCVWLGVDNSAFNDDVPLWRHLTFTQNFWIAENHRWGPDAISVTWTVAIEEHYYVLMPLLLIALPLRAVPAALLFIAIASALSRALVFAQTDSPFPPYVITLCRLDGLALGGAVAWLWRDPLVRERLRKGRLAFIRITLLSTLAIPLLAAIIARDLPWHMYLWGSAYLSIYFSLVLVSVLLAPDTIWARPLRNPGLQFLGRISYSVYLFHPLVLCAGFALVGRTKYIRDGFDALIVLAALGVTIMYCVASYHWMERRLIRYGRRFAY